MYVLRYNGSRREYFSVRGAEYLLGVHSMKLQYKSTYIAQCLVPVKTLWPSGLRRNVKAVVFIGGGPNPPGVTFCRPTRAIQEGKNYNTLFLLVGFSFCLRLVYDVDCVARSS